MNILTTICFRKNSKRLPHKYAKKICGRPLYMWTVDIADAWGRGDIVISTNDMGVFKKLPKWIVPCERPPYLCNDETPKIEVIRDALFFMEGQKRKEYDLIVDLDVCNPMRKKEDINKALDIAKAVEYQYPVVSAVLSYRNPYFNQVESLGKAYGPHIGELIRNSCKYATRRQDVVETFDLNNSIFVYPREFLADTKNYTIFGQKGYIAIYLMPPETMMDIDEPHHLIACEALMREYGYD